MKAIISCQVFLLLAAGMTSAGAQPLPHTPASLAVELRHLKQSLEEHGDSQTIPFGWQVETREGRFSISSELLRRLLAPTADPTERAANRAKARLWLDHLAQSLEGYAPADQEASSREHTALARILARPEFAGDRPPSAWDLFMERVNSWIERLILRILSFVAQHRSGSTILFWVVVAGAVGVIGAWLLRLWDRPGAALALASPDAPAAARTWEEWIRASRAAAGQGDLREAIRLSYWAGVARLDEIRILPADASHTPRERLRLLSDRQSGGTASLVESFSGLTSGLERFWYARRMAAADDFRASLRHLEGLGCKVD